MKSIHPRAAFRLIPPVCLFAVLLLVLTEFGQDIPPVPSPSPTISSQEARYAEIKLELERQKEIAELEAKIAEARKKALDALPTPKSSPKTGNVSISGDEISQEIIVYRELQKAVSRVAGSIRGTVPANATVAIRDSSDFEDWSFYRRSLPLFKVVVEDLTADYCLVANTASAGPPLKIASVNALATTLAGTGNLVGQFADLMSYLKTETTVAGKSSTINEDTIVAALFSELQRDPTMTLLYPKTFAVDSPVYCGKVSVERPCCASNAVSCLETRQVYCSEVANLLDDLYRARRAALAAKQQSPELRKLENYFADFLKLVAEATPTNVETALKKYVNAEQMAEMQKRKDLYYLEIKSLSAIGAQRVRKNLFFLSDKVDYSGGVIVQWTLFDKDGRVRNSGIETSYEGYTKPQNLSEKRP